MGPQTLNEVQVNKEQHGDLTVGLKSFLRQDVIHVAQAGLQKLIHVISASLELDPPASNLPSAGISGMRLHSPL